MAKNSILGKFSLTMGLLVAWERTMALYYAYLLAYINLCPFCLTRKKRGRNVCLYPPCCVETHVNTPLLTVLQYSRYCRKLARKTADKNL